jgi:hypothetical protein
MKLVSRFIGLFYIQGACSSIVVKTLCYKPKGHSFDSLVRLLDFSIYLILPATLGPGVYSASNRNKYQKDRNNVSGELRAAGV